MTFVSGVISRLKSRQPTWVDFYRVVSSVPNLETGKVTTSIQKHAVPKTIVLPPKMAIQLSQALSPLSAGMSFGGFLQASTTALFVDGKDLPEAFVLDTETSYAVIQKRKYEIKSIEEYLLREALIITVKAVQGIIPQQIFDRNSSDDLDFEEEYEPALV